MKEKADALVIRARLKLYEALERLANEEAGASDIVAILLVIVILIAVAAIFREQLTNMVTGVFEQLAEALGIE